MQPLACVRQHAGACRNALHIGCNKHDAHSRAVADKIGRAIKGPLSCLRPVIADNNPVWPSHKRSRYPTRAIMPSVVSRCSFAGSYGRTRVTCQSPSRPSASARKSGLSGRHGRYPIRPVSVALGITFVETFASPSPWLISRMNFWPFIGVVARRFSARRPSGAPARFALPRSVVQRAPCRALASMRRGCPGVGMRRAL